MPLIDPGLLTTADDVEIMRQAIRSAVEFISAPEWADYVLAPTSPVLTNNATDADIDAYITANGGTIFHPVGTAKMSPKGASHGVVDPDLTVKKVTGLRIVDASVMVRFRNTLNGARLMIFSHLFPVVTLKLQRMQLLRELQTSLRPVIHDSTVHRTLL